VREVLTRSEETALRVYNQEPYDFETGSGSMGWDNLAKKWNKPTLYASARPSLQKEVFRAVHAWRDKVAREEDESTR
jgi:exosome complex exonuclease RRP6